MPFSFGVSTTSAPSRASILRRSMDMVSGIVRMQRYPFAAHTNASAMPVLPDVGSTIVVPSPTRPSRSSASIIETPILSLTLAIGLNDSSFNRTSARAPWAALVLAARTSGVSPIVSAMLS
jgi:hypothetical protein